MPVQMIYLNTTYGIEGGDAIFKFKYTEECGDCSDWRELLDDWVMLFTQYQKTGDKKLSEGVLNEMVGSILANMSQPEL